MPSVRPKQPTFPLLHSSSFFATEISCLVNFVLLPLFSLHQFRILLLHPLPFISQVKCTRFCAQDSKSRNVCLSLSTFRTQCSDDVLKDVIQDRTCADAHSHEACFCFLHFPLLFPFSRNLFPPLHLCSRQLASSLDFLNLSPHPSAAAEWMCVCMCISEQFESRGIRSFFLPLTIFVFIDYSFILSSQMCLLNLRPTRDLNHSINWYVMTPFLYLLVLPPPPLSMIPSSVLLSTHRTNPPLISSSSYYSYLHSSVIITWISVAVFFSLFHASVHLIPAINFTTLIKLSTLSSTSKLQSSLTDHLFPCKLQTFHSSINNKHNNTSFRTLFVFISS